MSRIEKINRRLILLFVILLSVDVVFTYWALNFRNCMEISPYGFYPHTIIIPYLACLVAFFGVKYIGGNREQYILSVGLVFTVVFRLYVIGLNVLEILNLWG